MSNKAERRPREGPAAPALSCSSSPKAVLGAPWSPPCLCYPLHSPGEIRKSYLHFTDCDAEVQRGYLSAQCHTAVQLRGS